MRTVRLYYLAVVGILISFSSACGQLIPSPEIAALNTTEPPLQLNESIKGYRPTKIVIEGAVEDLVIEASVKVGLCIIDPSFCLPYSLEIEEECEKDPQNYRECCVAIASLSIQPEVFMTKFEHLREEFTKYEDRYGRRLLLPDDLEWIVNLNEQILQELFEELFSPEFTATSDSWIACEKKKTREEINRMFETKVQGQYGKVFRLCLVQPECFPLTTAMVTPMPDFYWNVPSSNDGSEVPLWTIPGPEVPFGTDCAWIYAPSLVLPACPQPRLPP